MMFFDGPVANNKWYESVELKQLINKSWWLIHCPPQWFIFLNERYKPSLHILYALHSTIARALPNLQYLQSIILSYYLLNSCSILAILDPVGQPSWPCSPSSLYMATTPLCPLLFSGMASLLYSTFFQHGESLFSFLFLFSHQGILKYCQSVLSSYWLLASFIDQSEPTGGKCLEAT